MKLSTTRVSRFLLAVSATAILVPVAQAATPNGPLTGFSHLQDLTAMNARYQAQAHRPPSVEGASHLRDLTAMMARYRVIAALAAGDHAQAKLSAPQTTARTAAGFDWGDATIGAASMLAFTLLLGAGTLISLHARNRRRDALAPLTS